MAKPESKAPVAPPEATPAWTAPREEIAGPAAKYFWFGTRATRTNRPPYSPWPQDITLGPVGFPLFTTFGPRLSGDMEVDEGNRLIPTLPGQSGTLLPGCVAKLSDDDIAEAREALAYHALRVAGGVLSQIDYRPSLFREALLRLLELREGGGRELPKARTRLEGRYLAQLSTWDLNALRAYVGDPKLTKQLTPRRDTDVSIGGCVYLQPCPDEIEKLAPEEARRWRPGGCDFFNLATLPPPLAPFTESDRKGLDGFCKGKASADVASHGVEEEVLLVAQRAGIDVVGFGDKLHDAFKFEF